MTSASTALSDETTASKSCPICTTPNTVQLAFARGGLTVWHCSVCEVEYLNPQPDDAALERIYAETYFFGTETESAIQRHQRLKTATAQIYLNLLGRTTGASATLLEIGCGTGDFLVEASSRGYAVTGVEISPSSTHTATKRLSNGTVICGTISSAGLTADSFDVVANSDVVEHVRDPGEFAREVARVMKPGGRLLMVTPSLDSWSRKVMGSLWMEYKPEHLYYFGRRSLTTLLARSGFVDINITPNVKVLSLDYVAKHFERFPVFGFSPLVRSIRRITPDAFAHAPVRIVASGMTAIARKP